MFAGLPERAVEKFTVLKAIAAPLLIPNIDTDVIIRIERVAGTAREELGKYALEALRFGADGSEQPEFVLNRQPFRRAKILLAGKNFGCGSSRENAVWALMGWGLRCVIAPSFGDIFFNNCFQNGLLPILLEETLVARLASELLGGEPELTVDLEKQLVLTAKGESTAFQIEPLRRQMLLEGLDEIGLTQKREPEIAAFQESDRLRRPWLY